MNLFYTTMTGYNDEQANPERSLGGFKSSTPVTNDDFSNLFDEISLMTIKTNRDEYRAIVLVNQFSETVKNIVIKLRRPDDAICSYKMAITPLNGVNKYNQHYMENVLSVNSKPFHAQFTDMVPGTELVIPELQPQAEIGIWICRHIDTEEAKKQYEDICRPDPNDPTGRRYIAVTHPHQESIDIDFSWD